MSGRRSAAWLIGGAVAVAAYLSRVRPRMLTWGATPEEAARSYPGDDLVPDAAGRSTMAATLPAPPEQVWPWLVQMGCNRAGWYSWDHLDNYGRPSAERIVPEWQSVHVGRHLPTVPGEESWFTVAELVPERTLVLRGSLALPSGRPFDPAAGPPSRAYTDGVWGFHLTRTPDNGTRLVVRTNGRSEPRVLTRPIDVLVWEPAHLIMQLRQFDNLRRRVTQGRSGQFGQPR